MTMSRYLVVFSVFILTVVNAFSMSVSDYKVLKKNDEQGLSLYVMGLGQGYYWSTSLLQHRSQTPLYCPPDKLVLNADNYLSILKGELASGAWKDTDPVEIILFRGLEKSFPCGRK